MTKFEDVIAWQKARVLVNLVYNLTAKDQFATDFGLRDQVRRATVSTMANIAEGFESGSHLEFGRYLTYAKSSCAEVRSHLYVAADLGYTTQSDLDTALEKASEVKRIIGGLKANLRPKSSVVKEEVILYAAESNSTEVL